jgi:hypothetical protein
MGSGQRRSSCGGLRRPSKEETRWRSCSADSRRWRDCGGLAAQQGWRRNGKRRLTDSDEGAAIMLRSGRRRGCNGEHVGERQRRG